MFVSDAKAGCLAWYRWRVLPLVVAFITRFQRSTLFAGTCGGVVGFSAGLVFLGLGGFESLYQRPAHSKIAEAEASASAVFDPYHVTQSLPFDFSQLDESEFVAHAGRGPGGTFTSDVAPEILLAADDGYRPLAASSDDEKNAAESRDLLLVHTVLDSVDSRAKILFLRSFLLSQDLSRSRLIVWMVDHDWLLGGKPWLRAIVDEFRWTPHRAVEFRLLDSAALRRAWETACDVPPLDGRFPALIRASVLARFGGLWTEPHIIFLKELPSRVDCAGQVCAHTPVSSDGSGPDSPLVYVPASGRTGFRDMTCDALRAGSSECSSCVWTEFESVKVVSPGACDEILPLVEPLFRKSGGFGGAAHLLALPLDTALRKTNRCSSIQAREMSTARWAVTSAVQRAWPGDARIVAVASEPPLSAVWRGKKILPHQREFYNFAYLLLSPVDHQSWREAQRQVMAQARGVTGDLRVHEQFSGVLRFVVPRPNEDEDEDDGRLGLEMALYGDLLFVNRTAAELLAESAAAVWDAAEDDNVDWSNLASREYSHPLVAAFAEAAKNFIDSTECRHMFLVKSDRSFINEFRVNRWVDFMQSQTAWSKVPLVRRVALRLDEPAEGLANEEPVSFHERDSSPVEPDGKALRQKLAVALVESPVGVAFSRDLLPLLWPPANPIRLAFDLDDSSCRARAEKLAGEEAAAEVAELCEQGQQSILIAGPRNYDVSDKRMRWIANGNHIIVHTPSQFSMTVADVAAVGVHFFREQIAQECPEVREIAFPGKAPASVMDATLVVTGSPCPQVLRSLDLQARLGTVTFGN